MNELGEHAGELVDRRICVFQPLQEFFTASFEFFTSLTIR